jgi:hypothetical protein
MTARDFLKGIQENIHTRVIAEFSTNLKLMFWPYYSRTRRLGELYKRGFTRTFPRSGLGPSGGHHEPFWLGPPVRHAARCLSPATFSFKLKYDNWLRYAKVPILVINATTLNTSHDWQFTASFSPRAASGYQL